MMEVNLITFLMLGNSSSERYKPSRVFQGQVPITFRQAPPGTHRVGRSQNIHIFWRMQLAAGGGYQAGNKVWAAKGEPGGVASTEGFCWKGGFSMGCGCHNLFLNFDAGCEIAFPPP